MTKQDRLNAAVRILMNDYNLTGIDANLEVFRAQRNNDYVSKKGLFTPTNLDEEGRQLIMDTING